MFTLICRTFGDLILAVVMKVFTGTVSEMLAQSLGLAHGRREGDFYYRDMLAKSLGLVHARRGGALQGDRRQVRQEHTGSRSYLVIAYLLFQSGGVHHGPAQVMLRPGRELRI